MRYLLTLLVAASAAAVGETASKTFPQQAIKQVGGSTVHITPSIEWEGEKKPQNASAYFLVTEYGVSGRIKLNQVGLRMSTGDLRQLHATLGAMIQEVEGKKGKAKKAE
jgi:hypothetical protein